MAFALNCVGDAVLFRQNIHAEIAASPCHLYVDKALRIQKIRAEKLKFMAFQLVHSADAAVPSVAQKYIY